MAGAVRYFECTCEVWVRPWFRKARPKIVQVCWAATDYDEFLDFTRRDMNAKYKRWKLMSWRELKSEKG
jgi:hypothetical protein